MLFQKPNRSRNSGYIEACRSILASKYQKQSPRGVLRKKNRGNHLFPHNIYEVLRTFFLNTFGDFFFNIFSFKLSSIISKVSVTDSEDVFVS